MPRRKRNATGSESLARALKSCTRAAREDYRYAYDQFGRMRGRLYALRARLAETTASRAVRATAGADTVRVLADARAALDTALTDHVDAAAARLTQLHAQLGRFTVVLFGRTMAGKSSLREAITGGDGATIGKGTQRTTRDVREYEWAGLRLVDTPGIGAFEGDEDRDKALALVREADFLLFLVSSDGIQEETFQGLAHVHDQRKPFAVALNWKANVDVTLNPGAWLDLEDLLTAPDRLFAAEKLDGHHARIRELTTKHLQAPEPEVHVVHAQAAFLSTQPAFLDAAHASLSSSPSAQTLATSSTLLDRSRLPVLLGRIETEVVERGRARRSQTLLDGLALALDAARTDLRGTAQALRRQADTITETTDRLATKLDRFKTDARADVARKVKTKLAPLRSSVSAFVDDNIQREDIGSRWKRRVEQLGLDDWQRQVQQDVVRDLVLSLEEFADDLSVEAALFDADLGDAEHHDPFDIRRAIRWAAAIVGGAAAAAAFFFTGAWVAGVVAGVVGLVSGWFKSKEQKLRERKEKLAGKLRGKLDDAEAKLTKDIQNWIDGALMKGQAYPMLKASRLMARSLSTLAAEVEQAADALDAQAATVHAHLVRRLLQALGGRPRADAITRVERPPSGPIHLVSDSPAVHQRLDALADLLGRPVTAATS